MDITTLSIAQRFTKDYVQEQIKKLPQSGANDYTELENKPKINGVELNGDLTPAELGLSGGGGSEKEWRLIRTITIPEDITTDTSGVNFAYAAADTPENGVLFGFDTDENGQPFACTQLLVYTENAANCSVYGSAVFLFDRAIPSYGGAGVKLYGVSANKKTSTTITIISKITDSNILSMGATNAGGANNNIFTIARRELLSISVIDKISCVIENGNEYGITPNSKFYIYGR